MRLQVHAALFPNVMLVAVLEQSSSTKCTHAALYMDLVRPPGEGFSGQFVKKLFRINPITHGVLESILLNMAR